jgi:hypothetical protein
MSKLKRRTFLKRAAGVSFAGAVVSSGSAAAGKPATSSPQAARDRPGHIENEYSLFLPGERETLADSPRVELFARDTLRARLKGEAQNLRPGDSIGGWELLTILPDLNGVATAVFEKHVTHQGAIVYVTTEGEIAHIPKRIGDLCRIRPRPVNPRPGVTFDRPARFIPGPDTPGNAVLDLEEDPSFENVAALGPEFIGWTLVANEEAGPFRSLWLEPDGTSRQFGTDPQSLWAPDSTGRLFDPRRLLPAEYQYEYEPAAGYSKRTLLGGYLPAADIGVWNPRYQVGYEVMMILPPGDDARPIGRVRVLLRHQEKSSRASFRSSPAPHFVDKYWNGSSVDFFSTLLGIWNHWYNFFLQKMKVEIPDEWLLDAARAGIVLCRCSYRGLRPTYQIGEGAYTKIPERSHALFPVAHYEFVWAHQLWNLAEEAEPYFEHYLQNYILPDGNFLYNTQDQVEAPLNAGVFLENSARAYGITHDFAAFKRRLPVLRRMIALLVNRYHYSKRTFPTSDPRHGLIWGSPEADKGNPKDDFPNTHPYYYQNASWTWRGLHEHARCLARAASEHHDSGLREEAAAISTLASEMRSDIERSLAQALAARNPAMTRAGITPFTPFDTRRLPTELSSYENHRYMMDWWTSDWGDPVLDEGHFKHRLIAGEQLMGMNTDGHYPRTSNFMSHGTLAGRIRQEDYRPFLLTLYGLLCYAMDCGSRYSPEDALLPGNFPGEGSPFAWSAVVNSELQPSLGLRWLLCYEEHDRDVVHLQKAAPRHWFNEKERIHVAGCPTRFGHITWTTESVARDAGSPVWHVQIQFHSPFLAQLVVHIHPPDRQRLHSASLGRLEKDRVVLPASLLAGKTTVELQIA